MPLTGQSGLYFPMPPVLSLSPRVRKSPFYNATLRYGAKAFTVYNHMYMPTVYKSPEEDYHSLITDVTLWDVAVERQVEVRGPDAAKLTQLLVTRDLSGCKVGQAKYVLLCDDKGGLLNDPVLFKLAEDHFWLSLADYDMLPWVKAVAMCHGFDVAVGEPDVSPLQVQGPKAKALMTELFGDWLNDMKFYHFRELEFEGMPLVVSRTGWSGEVGFELFLRDAQYGDELWERIMTAGKPYAIAPCAPSTIKRIEAGLMSYLTDMDWHNNPFEVGLGWVVDLEQEADFIGKNALRGIKAEGVKRGRIGLVIQGKPIRSANEEHWSVYASGEEVGVMTNGVYSPRLDKNIAVAILRKDYVKPDVAVQVHAPQGVLDATTAKLPFIAPQR